jgi:hypothetical protein
MKRILVAAFLGAALALGGCQTFSTISTAFHAVTGAKVTVQQVSVAATAFDGLKATGTNYLLRPRCSEADVPLCSKPEVAKAVIQAIDAGTLARNNLEAFVRDHPAELGTSGLYDALSVSISTLQGIFNAYGIKGGKS